MRWRVAAYALLTVALTWPLILHPRTLVPSDLGDPLLNVWIMWWNASTLPLTDAWWNAPQFFPFKGSFALSEHLLGLAPITTPIILATGEPLLAYNVAFLLSFFLCALATHFCVYTITRRHDVSFVAGMAFCFAPYRMPQIAHIQVLSAYWMPLALAGLHRYFQVPQAPQRPALERRWPWLVLFAGAWMMQALACGYFLFFLSVLVALWLAWFALFRGVTRDLLKAMAAWAVAAVLMAPVLYGYWRFSRAYNLRRTAREIRQFSADIASLLQGVGLEPRVGLGGRHPSARIGPLPGTHGRAHRDRRDRRGVARRIEARVGISESRPRASRPRRSGDRRLNGSSAPRSFPAADRGPANHLGDLPGEAGVGRGALLPVCGAAAIRRSAPHGGSDRRSGSMRSRRSRCG